MAELKALDEVAFIRFVSVYRNFQSKEEFTGVLKQIK